MLLVTLSISYCNLQYMQLIKITKSIFPKTQVLLQCNTLRLHKCIDYWSNNIQKRISNATCTSHIATDAESQLIYCLTACKLVVVFGTKLGPVPLYTRTTTHSCLRLNEIDPRV